MARHFPGYADAGMESRRQAFHAAFKRMKDRKNEIDLFEGDKRGYITDTVKKSDAEYAAEAKAESERYAARKQAREALAESIAKRKAVVAMQKAARDAQRTTPPNQAAPAAQRTTPPNQAAPAAQRTTPSAATERAAAVLDKLGYRNRRKRSTASGKFYMPNER